MNGAFSTYFQLGLEHILDLNGYDHILFIVTLCAIYVLSDWKKVALLATAFTIGHSLTLALASFDLIQVSKNWIEFLIPITIVITALLNILNRQPNEVNQQPAFLEANYPLALFFGLIHGLGFSNFFRASTLPGEESQFIWQLLYFNLGVEVGQLIIILLILLASFLAINVLNIRRQIWNWLISGIAGAIALFLAWDRLALIVS